MKNRLLSCLCVFLCAVLLCPAPLFPASGFAPQAFAASVPLDPADPSLGSGVTLPATSADAGSNAGANTYIRWASPVRSYLLENEDGTLTLIRKASSDAVAVNTFSADGKTLRSSRSIPCELSVFGGFYASKNYNYLVFGESNPEDSTEQTVVSVVQYSKSWARLRSLSLTGENTYEPFDAGSLRMTDANGRLYIHTCHEMFLSSDGYHHQANMTFVIREADCALMNGFSGVMNLSWGYVSHSFNQFIVTDGATVYRVDHGDAHPRGIAVTALREGNNVTNITGSLVPVDFDGQTGDNATGASLGAAALGSGRLLIAGNMGDPTNESYFTQNLRNIFVCSVEKSLASSNTRYITGYTEADGIKVGTPHLTPLGSDRFLLLWEETDQTTGKVSVRAACVNAAGEVRTQICSLNARLSDCAPILKKDGSVVWFVSDGSATVLYRLDANVMTTLAFTAHPKDITLAEGRVASFSVAANGFGVRYRWRTRKNASAAWTDAGCTARTLNVTAAASLSGTQYQCVLTDEAGNMRYSAVATLTVAGTLKITAQPQSLTCAAGSTAAFSVKAQGAGLTYQWRTRSGAAAAWTYTSGTAATFTVAAAASLNGRQYQCVVTDSAGSKKYSAIATLTVASPLTVTQQPKDVTAAVGSAAVFSVKAQGTGVSYQWRTRPNASAAWTYTNTTAPSLSVTAAETLSGRQYQCVLTDAVGSQKYTAVATLTVVSAMRITAQPNSVTAAAGSAAVFSIKAQGSGVSYQWRTRPNASAAWTYTNTTAPSLSVTAAETLTGRQYQCVLTDAAGEKRYSAIATLTVVPAMRITTQPNSVTAAAGSAAVFTVRAQGSGITYHWRTRPGASAAWTYTNTTAPSLSVTAAAALSGRQYQCVLTDAAGSKRYTSVATLTVK